MKSGQSLVTQLYFATSDKYRKFKSRIDKSIRTGRFKKLTQRRQSLLIAKLKRLYHRLRELQMQLKLAGATAAFSLITSFGASAQTLGPFNQNDAANPLPPAYQIIHPQLAVVDIDGDGDLDLFVGNSNGYIQFFRNDNGTGSLGNVKRFKEVTGSGNPFDGVNYGQHAAPAFADVDGDGDFDMLLGIGAGSNIGYTYFFRNTGNSTSPAFTEQTGASNPFDGITGPRSKYSTGPAIPAFVDIDGDTDIDLFVSGQFTSDYLGNHDASNYYENNNGTFTPAYHLLTGYLSDYSFSKTSMTFALINEDSDLDVILSDGSGKLRCFVYDSGEYTEQTGPWDPITRNGNPMNNFYFSQGSPVFADFDGDGDLDLIVGTTSGGYNSTSVQYFENTDGAYSFEKQDGLNRNPMGGVDVGIGASEQFVDIDNDGDLDAILGAKYNPSDIPNIFVYIRDEDGDFVANQEHPLVGIIPTDYDNVIPVFADIDADGDSDLLLADYDGIKFLRNNEGVFEEEPTLFPTFDNYNSYRLSLALIDIDNDGDLDAFIGNSQYNPPVIQYFENLANPSTPVEIQIPEFVEITPPAPFNTLVLGSNAAPNLTATDVDNDGDTDLMLSEGYYFDSGSPSYRSIFRFFENNGDGTFEEGTTPIPEVFNMNSNDTTPYLNLADLDGDGDLDGFIGNSYGSKDGQITFYENTNPPPTPTVASGVLSYTFESGPIILDANLTLADSDGDPIVKATVVIQNFQPGKEVLTFTSQAPVTGNFNSTTGVLTLQGKSTIAIYQAILRTVAYNYTGTDPGARKSGGGRTKSLSRTFAFAASDEDNTTGLPVLRTINIIGTNRPPIISPVPLATVINGKVTLDLLSIVSDPDGNLDPSTFAITQQPISLAVAVIDLSASILTVDYSNTSFSGLDNLKIRVADLLGSQSSETTIDILVGGDIIVRNGISPNSDALNDYFRLDNITALEPQNKVSIFNRWGDKVFEIDNYDNLTKKFEGRSDSGKDLPSGVYFYKIAFLNGRPEMTGYLTLKR